MNSYLSILQTFIRESASSTNPYLSVESKIKTYHDRPCHNLAELNEKNTKRLGTLWEAFCILYVRSLGMECYALPDVPDEWLTHTGIERKDFGIDLVAFQPETQHYISIQCKYRSPRYYKGARIHRVSWRELSTFLSLSHRTGPLQTGGARKWHQCWILTNAEGVTWKGHKTEYEKTIARETWMNMSRIEWMKCLPIEVSKEESIEESSTHISSPPIRELRALWLDKLTKKQDG